jgi:hypothetical protein
MALGTLRCAYRTLNKPSPSALARIIRETPAGGVLVDEVGAKVFLAVL